VEYLGKRRAGGVPRLTRIESRARTRERLLDAAEQVFAQRGYHAASVDEVAETAGYSKGAVYSNFASKEDLFLALFDRRQEQSAGAWAEVFGAPHSAQERAQAAERILEQGAGEGRRWTLLQLEFFLHAMRAEDSGAVQAQLAERYRRIRRVIAEGLPRQFDEAGSGAPLPVTDLAWVLPALATGLDLQAAVEPRALPAGLPARAYAVLLGDAKAVGAKS